MHPSEELLTRAYDFFARADMPAFLALCADDIVFEVPGNTAFSGRHTKDDFAQWIGTVMQICNGSFGERPVEIVANDEHGVVVLDHWLERNGKRIDYRVDHIWQIRDGVLAGFKERPGDEEIFNRART